MMKPILGSILALAVAFSVSAPAEAALSDAEADALFSKLDDQCAGNDNGGVDKFDPTKFDAKKAKRALRKNNSGCRGWKLSKGKEMAAKAFTKYLRSGGDYFESCVKETFSQKEREQILDVVNDPENLGVFSAEFDGGDESEACYFNHFHVYRKSGQLLRIVHDETD